MCHLAPEGPTRCFPPSPGSELRAARGTSRQAEVGQWLQGAHERLDTQLDRLMTRNAQLSYNINTAQLLDMKHKVSKDLNVHGNKLQDLLLLHFLPFLPLVVWLTAVVL